MLTWTIRLTTRQWLLLVEGNGELERAIRMLQKKVRQLDEEIGGETDCPLDTEEEKTSRAPALALAPAKMKEDGHYYYIIMIRRPTHSSVVTSRLQRNMPSSKLVLGNLSATHRPIQRSSRI